MNSSRILSLIVIVVISTLFVIDWNKQYFSHKGSVIVQLPYLGSAVKENGILIHNYVIFSDKLKILIEDMTTEDVKFEVIHANRSSTIIKINAFSNNVNEVEKELNNVIEFLKNRVYYMRNDYAVFINKEINYLEKVKISLDINSKELLAETDKKMELYRKFSQKNSRNYDLEISKIKYEEVYSLNNMFLVKTLLSLICLLFIASYVWRNKKPCF